MKLTLAGVIPVCVAFAQNGGREFLKLEATVPMPEVRGRIDHLAIDATGGRLFVAALGNNTMEIIDLKKASRIHTVSGLAEPQGIVYIPSAQRVFVANGRDGSVRGFDTVSWAPLKSISFGDDADNLRVDPDTGHLWVGYGSGALAEFDLDGAKLGEIKLSAHPESFQLEKGGHRGYVNLPKSRKVDVIDRESRTVSKSWDMGLTLSNYPMALDQANHRLFVVTRVPARLIVFDTSDGRKIATLATSGDCDDVFFDQNRRRIYAIGGEGAIAVFEQSDPDHYKELGRIKTVSGARTGLFSPTTDRLYLAVRKHESQSAEIRVYAPAQ